MAMMEPVVNVRFLTATTTAAATSLGEVSLFSGVRSNCSSRQRWSIDFIKSMDQRWRDEQLERTPLKRLTSPNEVAAAVVVAVKNLTFTTGSIIAIDGGRPLS